MREKYKNERKRIFKTVSGRKLCREMFGNRYQYILVWGNMRMEISLTVSYKVEMNKDDFWNPRTGELNTDIEEQLEQYFPEEIILSQKSLTTRNYISYISLEEGKNCLKCASCGFYSK